MKTEEFQNHVNHVAGVTLQTLLIEKSDKPDGSKHQIEMKEGEVAIWKVKFLKQKGTWKLASTERHEV